MNAFRPRRSVLYVPAINERAIDRARSLEADALIFDLEDAIDPSRKDTARETLQRALASGGFGPREIIVRINGLSTAWGAEDLDAVANAACDAVCLPKVESVETVRDAADRLLARRKDAPLPLWLMIETPRGVLAADALAAAHPSVAALVAGTSDLGKELRARETPDRAPFWMALQMIVLAARAHGITALDGVYVALDDEAGFEAACAQGARFGFDGKTLIHPRQISPANRHFSPSDAEIAWAGRVVAAHEKARAAGLGIAVLEGRLIEALHVESARRTLALAALTGREVPRDSAE